MVAAAGLYKLTIAGPDGPSLDVSANLALRDWRPNRKRALVALQPSSPDFGAASCSKKSESDTPCALANPAF